MFFNPEKYQEGKLRKKKKEKLTNNAFEFQYKLFAIISKLLDILQELNHKQANNINQKYLLFAKKKKDYARNDRE